MCVWVGAWVFMTCVGVYDVCVCVFITVSGVCVCVCVKISTPI